MSSTTKRKINDIIRRHTNVSQKEESEKEESKKKRSREEKEEEQSKKKRSREEKEEESKKKKKKKKKEEKEVFRFRAGFSDYIVVGKKKIVALSPLNWHKHDENEMLVDGITLYKGQSEDKELQKLVDKGYCSIKERKFHVELIGSPTTHVLNAAGACKEIRITNYSSNKKFLFKDKGGKTLAELVCRSGSGYGRIDVTIGKKKYPVFKPNNKYSKYPFKTHRALEFSRTMMNDSMVSVMPPEIYNLLLVCPTYCNDVRKFDALHPELKDRRDIVIYTKSNQYCYPSGDVSLLDPDKGMIKKLISPVQDDLD
jgi:hypothetical protein